MKIRMCPALSGYQGVVDLLSLSSNMPSVDVSHLFNLSGVLNNNLNEACELFGSVLDD